MFVRVKNPDNTYFGGYVFYFYLPIIRTSDIFGKKNLWSWQLKGRAQWLSL